MRAREASRHCSPCPPVGPAHRQTVSEWGPQAKPTQEKIQPLSVCLVTFYQGREEVTFLKISRCLQIELETNWSCQLCLFHET